VRVVDAVHNVCGVWLMCIHEQEASKHSLTYTHIHARTQRLAADNKILHYLAIHILTSTPLNYTYVDTFPDNTQIHTHTHTDR
jgi:hypothetical protein